MYLYRKYFNDFSISYFEKFIHQKNYLRNNSGYQERTLACALIFLNRDTNFLYDFLNVIFNDTDNMSLKISCLINYIVKNDEKENTKKFYSKYGKDKALLNKWFAIQIQYSTPILALARLRELTNHRDFNMFPISSKGPHPS